MIYNYNLDYMKQLKTYMKIRNIYFHICFFAFHIIFEKFVKKQVKSPCKKQRGDFFDRENM